jgi:hypothetical protein
MSRQLLWRRAPRRGEPHLHMTDMQHPQHRHLERLEGCMHTPSGPEGPQRSRTVPVLSAATWVLLSEPAAECWLRVIRLARILEDMAGVQQGSVCHCLDRVTGGCLAVICPHHHHHWHLAMVHAADKATLGEPRCPPSIALHCVQFQCPSMTRILWSATTTHAGGRRL